MARVYAADLLTLPSRTKRDKNKLYTKIKEASTLPQEEEKLFWEPQAQIYSIIFQQFESYEDALRTFRAIAEKNRRWCRDYYPSTSCYVGLSVTRGKGAKRSTKINNHSGRPCGSIKGERVPPHIHMIVYGPMAATYAQEFKREYNIKAGKTAAKHRKMSFMSCVSYVYNQSNLVRTSGKFDFSPYCIPYNKDTFPSMEDTLSRSFES